MPEPVVISELQLSDLDEILPIEEGLSSSWNEETWRRELALPHSWGFTAQLACHGRVAGYLLGWTIGEEAEIHKIATAPEYRRQGVATALLAHGLGLLRAQGVQRCFLELRASNLAACGLYRNQGFQECGRRKKYYPNPEEDAIMMQTSIHKEFGHEKY